MKIGDVMTRNIQMIGPDGTIQDTAQLMAEIDVSALPVGNGDEIQGIITERDIIIRVVAEGRDVTQTRVGDVMSSSLFFCRVGDEVDAIMAEMEHRQVGRMPVLDDDERPVGLVTLRDLHKATAGDDNDQADNPTETPAPEQVRNAG